MGLFVLNRMLLETNLTNTNRCKIPEKRLNPWHVGTHPRVLRECYPINANTTRLRYFKSLCVPVLWMKVALALEGLDMKGYSIYKCTIEIL